MNELAKGSTARIRPQIREWKQKLLAEGLEYFSRNTTIAVNKQAAQGGRVIWSKLPPHTGARSGSVALRPKSKRSWSSQTIPELSVRRQCELLRAGTGPHPPRAYDGAYTALNLHLMRLMDEQYLKMPFLVCSS